MENKLLFEAEVLKNYFINNEGFGGLHQRESRLYNYLSQLKHHSRFEEMGVDFDVKAPGGMTTVLFKVMGAGQDTRIESYAQYLVDLKYNNIKMTAKENTALDQFREYYNYPTIKEFMEDNKKEEVLMSKHSDILITTAICNLILNSDRIKYYQNFMQREMEEKQMDMFTYMHTYGRTNIKDHLKKILPQIKVQTDASNFNTSITNRLIVIQPNQKINWMDLILMLSLGLTYRGLYTPALQLGLKLHDLYNRNYMFYSADLLLRDDLYRRAYKIKTLPEFWGIEGDFPTFSYNSGYILFPTFDRGELTGNEGLTEIYGIWMPPYPTLYTDEKTLPVIYPHLNTLRMTEDYYSETIGKSPGYKMPCVANDEGTVVPLVELLFNSYPFNNDYYNMTSRNIGMSND